MITKSSRLYFQKYILIENCMRKAKSTYSMLLSRVCRGFCSFILILCITITINWMSLLHKFLLKLGNSHIVSSSLANTLSTVVSVKNSFILTSFANFDLQKNNVKLGTPMYNSTARNVNLTYSRFKLFNFHFNFLGVNLQW